MANKVYANGLNVACKTGQAKVICGFPDVCLSPPSPPAGPIPLPYPVTSMSSDTKDGSGKVKVANKPAMVKSANYGKCMGDEAATKTLGMGVINANLGGKVYFKMSSMDVTIEGEKAVRAFDITTSNHRSESGNEAVPMINTEAMAFPVQGDCDGVSSKFELKPYKTYNKETKKMELSCKSETGADGNPKTGHHVIPTRCMKTEPGKKYPEGCSHDKAPVICVTGRTQYGDTEHAACHASFDACEYKQAGKSDPPKMTYKQAKSWAAVSCKGAKGSKLEKNELECIKAQLDGYFKNCLECDENGKPKDDNELKASASRRGKNLSALNNMKAATPGAAA